jgi:spore maturation protein CgeB
MTPQTGTPALRIELFTASSGQPSAKAVLPDGRIRHLHSLVAPERESEYFADLELWGDVIVLCGFGLGYHIAGALTRLPESSIIVLAEFHEELVSRAVDGAFAHRKSRLLTLSEKDDASRPAILRDFLSAKKGGSVQIIKHPASYRLHRAWYDAVVQDAMHCVRIAPPRRSAHRPLLLHGSFFLQDELRRAFGRTGGDAPALFRYGDYGSGTAFVSALERAVQTEKPDVIVSVNMQGFDGNGALPEIAGRFGIPVIVWFVDDPHPILLHQRQFVNRSMIACCWEKAYLPFLDTCGFGKTGHLPLAGDPSVMQADTPAQPSVPIGFIGSSMGEPFLAPLRRKFLWRDDLAPIADRAAGMLLDRRDADVDTLLDQAARETSIAIPFSDPFNRTWLRSYVIHLAGMKMRAAIIAALLPAGIETFGDPEGWRALIGPGLSAHPDLDYATELKAVYRSIAVNINITSRQMPSAVNQRVFDVPLAGSFLLTDDQRDMRELFDAGSEAITYASIEDLKEKAAFYIARPHERGFIMQAARKRILAEHTYTHRVKRMLELLC